MLEPSLEIIAAICGLACFALGLGVVARASAHPPSGLRSRLYALGAFGILHAVAAWSSLFAAGAMPDAIAQALYVPGFLALYYFAYGGGNAPSGLAHALVLGTVALLGLILGGVVDAGYLPPAIGFGVALPASFSAAYVFFRGGAFPAGEYSGGAERLAALSFALYGALFLVLDPAIAAASGVNALAGLPQIALSGVGLTLLAALMILFNRFDAERFAQGERRIAEADEILAKSKSRLNRALGFAGVGCWEWDIATGEVRWSDQMYRIYGYAVQEFLPSLPTLIENVHADDREAVEQALVRALDHSVSYEIDYRITRPDESIRFVRAHCDVDSGPGGAAMRLIGTINDVTNLVKAKVAAEEAKTAAEAASVAKSNFMANMSHELRTPLNAVIGFAEILEKEILGTHSNPLYKTYAADITKGGKHLLAVINDILTVSRYEAGQMHLEEDSAINVEEMLKRCVRWVENQASQGEVVLHASIAPNLPALRGDPRLLVQAFLNLLSNAVKFSPRNGVVEIGAQENRVGGLNVWVSDQGIGMTPEQIARIGEPFLQFDDARNRKYEGTGLGLRIAKQILTMHAADMEIQSTPGEGTVFSINLPPGRSVRLKAQRMRAWG